MTNNVKQDAEQALKLIKFSLFRSRKFSKHSALYAFTNENINGTFNKISFQNKTFLTSAGSGDSIIEALLRNASLIESFDINKLTKYYIPLKFAAIQALEYDEFIKYLFLENNIYNTFNEESYNKIRKYLNEEDIIFWDTLYSKYSGKKIRSSKLFYSTEEDYTFLKNCLSYLKPKNYYKLKELLKNEEISYDFSSKFHNCCMTDLPNTCKGKFNIINLSNIADFIDEIYKRNPVENFKNYIINELTKIVDDEGIILVAYMFWANRLNQADIPIINQTKIRQRFFNKDFEEWVINNSHIPDCTNDHLLVYKKSK